MVIGLSEVNKCHQCFPHKCWEMPTVKQRLCHWSRMSHVLVTVTPGNAYSSWATAARGEYPAPLNNRNPWQRESRPHAREKLWSFRLGVTETVNLTSWSLLDVVHRPAAATTHMVDSMTTASQTEARRKLVGHTKSLADPNISAKGENGACERMELRKLGLSLCWIQDCGQLHSPDFPDPCMYSK